MANWYLIVRGHDLPDEYMLGGLTAWTCRPGRNGPPGRRWRVVAVGTYPPFRPIRSVRPGGTLTRIAARWMPEVWRVGPGRR